MNLWRSIVSMMPKRESMWFTLVGVVVILMSCGQSANVTEAYFEAPKPEDKDFLSYSGLSDPFHSEAVVDETLKTVKDDREVIWMDDYSGRYYSVAGRCYLWSVVMFRAWNVTNVGIFCGGRIHL